MPRIPVSGVQQQGLPSVSLQSGSPTVSSHGSLSAKADQAKWAQVQNLGQAGQNVANSMVVRAEREQAEYDNGFAREKEVGTNDWYRDTFRSQTDTFRGGDASSGGKDGDGMSVYDRMDKLSKDHYKEQTKGMTKDQLRLYQPGYDRARQVYMGKADAYVSQQVDGYKKNQQISQIASREDQAIGAGNDPALVATLQYENEQDLRDFYKGASPELIDEKIQNMFDRVDTGVVDTFLKNGDTAGAWNSFSANKSDMSEKAQKATKIALEAASLKNHSTNAADKIELDTGGDYQAALEAAQNLKGDGQTNVDDLRTETTRLLKSRYNERKQRNEAYRKAKVNQGVEYILNLDSPNRAENLRIAEDYINAGYTGGDRLNLLNKARSINKSGHVVTNSDDWKKLTHLSVNDTPNFTKLNLNDYQLSESDQKSFFKTQETLKKGGNPKTELSWKINQSFLEVNPEYDSKDTDQTGGFSDWKDEINQQVFDAKKDKGRDLTIPEVNEIIQSTQINYKLKEIEDGEIKKNIHKGGFSLGYGPDVSIAKALRDPSGLPDIDDDVLRSDLSERIKNDGNFIVNDTTMRVLGRVLMGGEYTDEMKKLVEPYRIK